MNSIPPELKVEPDMTNALLSSSKPIVAEPLDKPIRLAIIGCGAITRFFHLPVLAGHEGIRLVALVDCNVARTKELAAAYKVAKVFQNIREVNDGAIDAALVATPPSHHAPCCIELARRGVHVLVEKPIAATAAQALAMVQAAEEAGVVLSVGLFRRLLPSTRILRAILDSGAVGSPLGFSIRSGSFYGWPSATLGNMRRDQSGGGVLIDMGSHVIDMLLFLLPGQVELLEYRDNSLGGIESECWAHLRIFQEDSSIEGTIEMSRTRKRPGGIRINCERATLELALGAENHQVTIHPVDVALADPITGIGRDFRVQASWADVRQETGFAAVRVQVDDWIDAIRTGRAPQLSGRSALPAAKIIDDCYRQAGRLREPWVEEGIISVGINGDRDLSERNVLGSSQAVPAVPRSHAAGRVLVTGASGFIGCRVAEILHFRDGWTVRALVNNPAHASRLARLPVEMIQGDLRSKEQMQAAVEGCDTVVHCAIGTAYGQSREVYSVTVGGTKNLADAALAARIRRFIHISTIAVHGDDVVGSIFEETPIRPATGDYGPSKAEAERMINRAIRRGLPAITLRLANIYGPFGKTFVIDPIQRLVAGQFLLVGGDRAPSNTVYVDDVAEAIARSLGPDGEAAVGEVFCIGADDEMSWEEFYHYFANGLGVSLQTAPSDDQQQQSPKRAGGWVRGLSGIAKSPELRAFGRKVLETDPYGRLPRWFLESFPGIERNLRRSLKLDEPPIYRAPALATGGNSGMVRRPKTVLVRTDKARRLLDYKAVVPRQRAMDLTLDWVRHALVPDQVQERPLVQEGV